MLGIKLKARPHVRSRFRQEDSGPVIASLRPPASPSFQIRIRIALIGGKRQGKHRSPRDLLRLAAADNTNDRTGNAPLDHIKKVDRIELGEGQDRQLAAGVLRREGEALP